MAARLTSIWCLVTLACSVNAELCKTKFQYEFFIQGIMENAPLNSIIGHIGVNGTDDQISLTPDTHPLFFFDSHTRNVSLIGELNTDVGSTDIDVLKIKCKIIGQADEITLSVQVIVTDYNDNSPEFTEVHHTVAVSEDTLDDTIIYSGTTATDKDKPYTGNSRLTYRVVTGTNYSDYFEIKVPTKPDITLMQELDYETVSMMEIEIEATDDPQQGRGEQRSSTATLTIAVIDADDQNPIFGEKSYRGSISEDAIPDTLVEVLPPIMAYDPDTMNASIVYKILDPYELFAIDENTAAVRNVKTLSVDVPMLTVVVLATQTDNPDREWFTVLSISITAANVNAPRFSSSVYEVTKTELEPVGSILLTTTATDTDFGTLLKYDIVETTADFRIDDYGRIFLEQPLDYELETQKTLRVTASDGSHTATATVKISVTDVNDNNPVLLVTAQQFQAERQTGDVITMVTATDEDINDVLTFELRSFDQLFAITNFGEVSITAQPELLVRDTYPLLIVVIDNGFPAGRESSKLIEVNFPPLNPPTSGPTSGSQTTTTPSGDKTTIPIARAATQPQDDSMLVIILGAIAGVLLVVILVLLGYVCVTRRRMKEELNRARAPRGHSAKGLTYRQAEVPDDLPKMDLGYSEETETEYDIGATSVQKNPLRDSGVNQGYLQSSGSEMDRDVSEIEIETAVVPYDEDFDYEHDPQGFGGNTSTFRTFHGDDTTSNESSHSDSTGGSQHILVNGGGKSKGKLTSWDSNDKVHTQGAEKLLDSKTPPATEQSERPEITVYF